MKHTYTVFEVDYHERSHRIGEFETMAEARKAARDAFKKSGREFPVFIMSGGKCIANYR